MDQGRGARSLIGLAVALAGCGRIDFDALGGRDAVAADAADPCALDREPRGPWSAPVLIGDLSDSGASDDDPELRGDGLELLFTSNRAGSLGGADVWRARRASPTDAWGPVEHVAELSTVANENTLALSDDGLTIWFASDRPGSLGNEDLWVATRPALDAPWSVPTNVAELNTAGQERGPSVFRGGRSIVFHTGRAGGPGGQDLWLARRDAVDLPWSPPVPFGSPPNTDVDELRAWMSPCGLELYFQADRGSTTMDFYVARRASTEAGFGPEQRIDELSGPEYDQDLRLSADRRHAVFSSLRTGNGDLYEASR